MEWSRYNCLDSWLPLILPHVALDYSVFINWVFVHLSILSLPIVSQICAGGMHTVALSKAGRVFSWGCNDEGSLGRLADDGTALSDEDECAVPGEVVTFPEGTPKIVQISAGDSHSAALTEQGAVFFWGGWRDNSGESRTTLAWI